MKTTPDALYEFAMNLVRHAKENDLRVNVMKIPYHNWLLLCESEKAREQITSSGVNFYFAGLRVDITESIG